MPVKRTTVIAGRRLRGLALVVLAAVILPACSRHAVGVATPSSPVITATTVVARQLSRSSVTTIAVPAVTAATNSAAPKTSVVTPALGAMPASETSGDPVLDALDQDLSVLEKETTGLDSAASSSAEPTK